MRLLVVEDEQKVASFIQQGLTEEGHAVDLAHDGDMGLAMALDRVHDLIVLDISLPKKNGIEVLKTVRQAGVKTPILLLTVRANIEDKVLGLDAGADDYLTKPFAFEELVARIRALAALGRGATLVGGRRRDVGSGSAHRHARRRAD